MATESSEKDKSIEIFKTGKHTAISGQALTFSDADLEASARAYNPAVHEAPIVVGHPLLDAPAYGWIRSLSFSDSRLLAEPRQVDPAFADLVREGKFKKLSASFYTPEAPQNPVPGVYYLRHVGFLGAVPPAVKGLKPVSFADAEEGVIEFGDWRSARTSAGLWRGLRDWFISKFGIEEADKVIPSYSVQDLEEAAAMPGNEDGMAAIPAYSEGNHDGDPNAKEIDVEKAEALAAREAELAKKEAQFAERESKLKEKETAARHAGHVSFVEGLVKEGKLLPAQKDHAAAILAFTSHMEGQTVEFGETKKSPIEIVQDFFSGLPKAIEYSEIATPARDPGKGGAAEKLETLTLQKMQAKPDIGFTAAFAEVQTEHPELAREYADTMRG